MRLLRVGLPTAMFDFGRNIHYVRQAVNDYIQARVLETRDSTCGLLFCSFVAPLALPSIGPTLHASILRAPLKANC